MKTSRIKIILISAALGLAGCTQGGSAPSNGSTPSSGIDHFAIAQAIAPQVIIEVPIISDCNFDGTVVLNNTSVTAYQTSSVPFGSQCVSETRSCTDGLLSGSYNYSSCQVQAAASCLFDGVTIAHGDSVNAYANSSVVIGGECVSETRTCNNGTLSGSYAYPSCGIEFPTSCQFNGQTVANGASVPAFLNSSVAFGETCQLEYRTCENGVLSGSNQYASCDVAQPQSCVFDGRTLSHGESVNAFVNSSVAFGQSCTSEVRVCNNGQLSGSNQYSTCSVAAPSSCLFNGETIAHGEEISAFASSSVAYGQMCQVETRVCDDGHLSGSYSFASCDAGQPSACLFNGQTIPHGAEVVAYESSAVSSGSCNSQTRTCDNGALSGNFAFASCEVNQPKSCLFNGLTIANGQKVMAYKESESKNGKKCEAEERTCNDGVLSGTYAFSSCASQNHDQEEDDDDMIKICKHVVDIKHKEHYSRHPNNGLHLGWYKFKERLNCGKHKGWYKHKNKKNHPKCNDSNKWYKNKDDDDDHGHH